MPTGTFLRMKLKKHMLIGKFRISLHKLELSENLTVPPKTFTAANRFCCCWLFVCNWFMFCCTLLNVHSSIPIILMGKRELVALLNLSSWCLVMVEWLFLVVPWGCLRFVIVVFPDHTHYFHLSEAFHWIVMLTLSCFLPLHPDQIYLQKSWGQSLLLCYHHVCSGVGGR